MVSREKSDEKNAPITTYFLETLDFTKTIGNTWEMLDNLINKTIFIVILPVFARFRSVLWKNRNEGHLFVLQQQPGLADRCPRRSDVHSPTGNIRKWVRSISSYKLYLYCCFSLWSLCKEASARESWKTPDWNHDHKSREISESRGSCFAVTQRWRVGFSLVGRNVL